MKKYLIAYSVTQITTNPTVIDKFSMSQYVETDELITEEYLTWFCNERKAEMNGTVKTIGLKAETYEVFVDPLAVTEMKI